MNSFKKNIKFLIYCVVIGIIGGIIYALIKYFFDIPDDFMYTFTYSFVFIYIALYFSQNFYYIHKLKKASHHIENFESEKYIEEIEPCLKKVGRLKNIKNLMKLDLSVAYLEIKNYKKAIEFIESIDESKLDRTLLSFYRVNMPIIYFYAGKFDKSKELYDKNIYFYIEYATSKKGDLLKSIQILHIMNDFIENKILDAKNKILELEKIDLSPRFKKSVDELKDIVYKKK